MLADERHRRSGGHSIRCHRCKASVEADSAVCFNCGTLEPRNHSIFTVPAVVGATLVLVITVSGWSALGKVGSAAATPVASESPPPVIQDAGPETVVAPPTPEPASPVVLAVSPPQSDPPAPNASLETRWTVTWANVRANRGIDAPVSTVLDPGARIEVTSRRNGWWEVHLDGKAIGYVANSVLDRRPPEGAIE